MASVGFSEAARLAGVSRQYLYKMAETGQISVLKDLLPGRMGNSPKDYRQSIDVSELRRVFNNLSLPQQDDSTLKSNSSPGLEAELVLVRQELHNKEERLREAKDREEWMKKQIDEITAAVKLISYSTPKQEQQDVISRDEHDKMISRAKQVIHGLRQQLKEEQRQSRKFWYRLFGRD